MSALVDFQRELKALHQRSGEPAFRIMEKRTKSDKQLATSRSTFQRVLNGSLTTPPSPRTVHAFAAALGLSDDDSKALLERYAALLDERQKPAGRSATDQVDGPSDVQHPMPIPHPDDHSVQASRGDKELGAQAQSEDPGRAGSRRHGRRWLAVGGAAVALALAAAVTVIVSLAATRFPELAVTVTGRVTCVSAEPVTGVYVAAPGGNFANWHAVPDHPATADFAYQLPPNTPYAVHVGCGGSAIWAHEDWSDQVVGDRRSFLCTDGPPNVIGHCRPST